VTGQEYECCASGSCEVCRRPQGYSHTERERMTRELRDYDPPWVRERLRDDLGSVR